MHQPTDEKEVSTWPGVKHVEMITIRRFKSRLLVNRTRLTVLNAPSKPLRLAAPTVTVGSSAMAWKHMALYSVVPIVPPNKEPVRCGIAFEQVYRCESQRSRSDARRLHEGKISLRSRVESRGASPSAFWSLLRQRLDRLSSPSNPGKMD